MTCRRSCDRGQPPCKTADVLTFLIDAPKPGDAGEPEAGTGEDEAGDDVHLWALVPPDRPVAGPHAPGATYRFAWNG